MLENQCPSIDSEIGTLPGAQLHTDGYDGQAKIVVDEDRHVMLGATFIGPQVSDLLHAATVATWEVRYH